VEYAPEVFAEEATASLASNLIVRLMRNGGERRRDRATMEGNDATIRGRGPEGKCITSYRPVSPLRPEPSEGRDEAAADSRFVEVERRPLAEYARIAGGAR